MPIIVAGNTVEGEERLILAAWRQSKTMFPDMRLIIAPRQPKRFDEAAKLLADEGLPHHRASSPWPTGPDSWRDLQALLLDTIGELASVYKLGSVALVGGGWRWHGGHNPLEPVFWGVPTLIGPGCANFEDLVEPLMESGCLKVVADTCLADEIQLLLRQPCSNTREQSPFKLPKQLQGGTQRTWELLKPFLPTEQRMSVHS